ncbi:MAG TPA: DUF3179 domain-containing protein [Woeseiaceae bacterium]|nr:DUF3179 domain-containing protein [Woeseiaceae bacterium]
MSVRAVQRGQRRPPFPGISLFALTALLLLALADGAGAQGWETDILRDTFGYGEGTPADVDWNEIEQGCGARDCIPSIDEPRFVAADEAEFLSPADVVMGIEIDGDARAYPISILNFHEIVNDEIGGRPVAITYCPLCGSGIAFDRKFGEQVVEFGVSGLLRKSDLILYDRATESLWQQITGRAFAGPMRGEELEPIPVSITRWVRWRDAHPDTRVLSTDTGFERPYSNKTPYGDYDESRRLLFPVDYDRSLHPKTVVHGVEVGDASYAVTESVLQAHGELEQPGEPGVRWEMRPGGEVTAVRGDTGERLVTHRMFWFAWYSFHTTTRLYTEQDDADDGGG